MRSVKGPFPMRVRYEFEDADGGTRVRIRIQGGATTFYRLAAPLISGIVKRNVQNDLRP